MSNSGHKPNAAHHARFVPAAEVLVAIGLQPFSDAGAISRLGQSRSLLKIALNHNLGHYFFWARSLALCGLGLRSTAIPKAMQAPTQIPLRILEIHKAAMDNIRFLKGQQWLVTNFITALNGVLFLIVVESETAARFLLTALATLVSLYGVLMIVNFQTGIQDARQRRNWIYQKYFTDEECQELGLLQPSSWSSTLEPFMSWTREPFIMMIAVIVAGWVVGISFVIKLF